MKAIQSVIAAWVLGLSSVAWAEGGGERTFQRAMDANQQAMERYATQQGKSVPKVEPYRYGMNLDISRVVSMTPPLKSCGLVPSRMTYEDSAGQLRTIEYQVQGQCRNNGS